MEAKGLVKASACCRSVTPAVLMVAALQCGKQDSLQLIPTVISLHRFRRSLGLFSWPPKLSSDLGPSRITVPKYEGKDSAQRHIFLLVKALTLAESSVLVQQQQPGSRDTDLMSLGPLATSLLPHWTAVVDLLWLRNVQALLFIPWALARLEEETCLKAPLLSQPKRYPGIAEPLLLSSQVASVISFQSEARNSLLHPYTYYFWSWAKIDLSVSFLFPCCLTDWQVVMDSLLFSLTSEGWSWCVYQPDLSKCAFKLPQIIILKATSMRFSCLIFKSIPSWKPGNSGDETTQGEDS